MSQPPPPAGRRQPCRQAISTRPRLTWTATEELLVEAHQAADTPLLAATLFVGFFALCVLDASH